MNATLRSVVVATILWGSSLLRFKPMKHVSGWAISGVPGGKYFLDAQSHSGLELAGL